MAHIILTGATGSAGSAILAYALKSEAISQITVLSRRPVKLAENESKTNVILQKDFESYPQDILKQLEGATGCIWAQGISSRGMSEAEYSRITTEYPCAAAKAFAKLGPSFNFVYISGEGAQTSEESSMMYGRVKGRTENALLALTADQPQLKVYNLRPAIINPQGEYLAERKVTLHDRLSTLIGGISEKVWKSGDMPASALAKVCVDLAVSDGAPISSGEGVEVDGRVLRNVALRRLAGI